MDFIALDFETANADRNSVCALGVAIVKDGTVVERYYWLIRPPELYFDPYNTMIHGITEDDVKDQPEFSALWPSVAGLLSGNTIVAHNASFDMSVLRAVLSKYEINYPSLKYHCTRIVAQRTWRGLTSYSLDTVAHHLGIMFKHHNAEEDALASAEVFRKALESHHAVDIEDLCCKTATRLGELFLGGYRPASGATANRTKQRLQDLEASITDFDESHPLFGKSVVFTGTLMSMQRKQAAQRVVDCGGTCSDSLNSETDFLILGLQDYKKLRGGDKSSKMIKAEKMISLGSHLEIISEDEFLRLL